MRPLPAAFAPLLLAALSAQEPRASLDGKPLVEPAALISPLGWLEVHGRREAGAAFAAKLRFPPLEWLPAGTHTFDNKVFDLRVGDDGKLGEPLAGSCSVEVFGPARVRMQATYKVGADDHRLEVDLAPQVYVPKWQPEVKGSTTLPDDQPDHEDVVFCAIANCGTGMAGQRQVAESMAALAATGPLDFVLVAGNMFLPRGVKDRADPQFQTSFEQVYDSKRLAVPFLVAPGPADLRGSVDTMLGYGTTNQRWVSHPEAFTMEFVSRGKKLAVFGGNSEWMAGPIPNPRTRAAIRRLVDPARDTKADWKIVVTNGQLLSTGDAGEPAQVKALDERTRYHLVSGKVDLLIHGDARAMRMFDKQGEIPQVLAGGGGGPEIGQIPKAPPGTAFAYGGGGFVWFRFDGSKLQISFRDAEGKVLHVHELKKP